VVRNGKWSKEKEKMLRTARRASGLAWSMVIRAGNMTVKGLDNMWKAFVRPHLEYGAEVMDSHRSYKWEDAEVLLRANGRRILKGGTRLSNEAVVGELGWMSIQGRRMLLRLMYRGRGKILRMDSTRLLKKVYPEC